MRDVLVLCYHAVSPSWDAPLSVRPDRLERQLKSLLRRGYRGATFADAVCRPSASRTLAVTFDDAYRSVLDLAFPILDRLRLPGTVFVPTDFAGKEGPMSWPGIDGWVGGPHERELHPLGWQELRRLRDAGWEVGSHTVSHPKLTDLDDRALGAELRESRTACEHAMDAPCESIAYPYGDVDARVARASGEAGYTAGAALPARFDVTHPLQWPRVGIYHADAQWRFWLKASRPLRRLRSFEAGERVAAALRR